MQFRQLGTTGVEVSVVAFGASPLGNVFGAVSTDHDDNTVGAAIDTGINLFDVSPYYGMTLAEARLGEALRGRRDSVYLATKCGRYGAHDFDFSAAGITARLEDSLRRLRTDNVDCLQVHDVEFGSYEQILHETLPAMQRLQAQGKVRWIGVTGYWPGMLARLVETADLDVVLSYCHGNLFVNDMEWELMPAAKERGVGVLNASPLHMGLLGSRPVPAWHPAPAEVRAAADQVVQLCRAQGVDAAMLALQYCLLLPGVASTLVGIGSAEEANAAAAAVEEPPETELLQRVQAVLQPVLNRTWSSGRPENADRYTSAHTAISAGAAQ